MTNSSMNHPHSSYLRLSCISDHSVSRVASLSSFKPLHLIEFLKLFEQSMLLKDYRHEHGFSDYVEVADPNQIERGSVPW